MNEAKLQEIEARANEATPGPWHARTGRTYADGKVTSVEHYIARGDDDVGIASEVCDSRTGDPSPVNALFLAAARTDVPALIAEVRRLTDALRRLKSRPDERRLPCDGDARAEAAMARDAADEADPAWWRGHDAAVRGMMTVVRRALTEPPRGAYGSEEAREVDASIRAVRTKLDAARREGAEGMREAALRCCSPDDDHFDGFHAPDVWEQIEREIRALPLDAPGGAS